MALQPWLWLVVAACDATVGGRARVTIDASGSTFQKAAQEVWADVFRRAHRHVTINYAGGGSGKGRQDFADGTVDFACTDAPFKPAERARVRSEFFYIPTLLGAITVSYHLPGDPALVFSAATLADIFERRIDRWNAPAIANDNPGITLPDLEIVVVRRSDGSGTTENFTRFLAEFSGGAWKRASGSTVAWPTDTRAGYGNGGVARIVKTTVGAIGYLDLSDAKASRLTCAAIENRAGRPIYPDVASVTAAGEGIEIGDDLVFSALAAGNDLAYPITAPSWCMVYAKPLDPVTGGEIAAYFRYVLTDGQALLAEIDFAPLPSSLRTRVLAQIERLAVGTQE